MNQIKIVITLNPSQAEKKRQLAVDLSNVTERIGKPIHMFPQSVLEFPRGRVREHDTDNYAVVVNRMVGANVFDVDVRAIIKRIENPPIQPDGRVL